MSYASLYRQALDLDPELFPARELCHCKYVELPWVYTKYQVGDRAPVDHCPRCAAPWFRL